jgi:hypothetical protein
LIGVIPKPEQAEVVKEFFELFKTPWELYRPDRVYDVIIATGDGMPEASARLLLVYSPAENSIDARIGVSVHRRLEGAVLNARDALLPIYREMATFADHSKGVACVTAGSETAGIRTGLSGSTVIRLGYDLFDEIEHLLSSGQPVENAHLPTLEIHIRMLRQWILEAGIPLIEIPPAPAGHSFSACLTHDIDFVGIRNHKFDHTMWGFVYRATVGAVRNFFRGRLSLARLLRNWRTVLSLPFVYAGWAKDVWEPFAWYLNVEAGLPATYFLIPFKRRPGENLPGGDASRRAAAYDVTELSEQTTTLLNRGCELGVHGIDSWHSVDKGREELTRIAAVVGAPAIGTRIHWLLRDTNTPAVLERAGYAYDSTFGYNETVGYRTGTGQVFRPLGAKKLLEIPLHIQDGALFYPQRLDLPEAEAEERCRTLVENASRLGGVLTLLWHDRSHAPERYWGDFYIRLLRTLKATDCWFGTAGQVVDWFRKRREVRFELVETEDGSARACPCYDGEEVVPPLNIRLHRPCHEGNDSAMSSPDTQDFVDIPWNGVSRDEVGQLLQGSFGSPDPVRAELAS